MARRASGHGTSPEVHVLESHGLLAMYFRPMDFRLWTLNLWTSELGTSELETSDYVRLSNQLDVLTSTSQQFAHFGNFNGGGCHVWGSLVTPVIVPYVYLRSTVGASRVATGGTPAGPCPRRRSDCSGCLAASTRSVSETRFLPLCPRCLHAGRVSIRICRFHGHLCRHRPVPQSYQAPNWR